MNRKKFFKNGMEFNKNKIITTYQGQRNNAGWWIMHYTFHKRARKFNETISPSDGDKFN